MAHLVRAAGAILDVNELLVIGSQSILGSFTEEQLPPPAILSIEADLLTRDGSPESADLIDGTIGELSPFHDTFGVYAQGVDRTTARLPSGWEDRLVRFERADTGGVVAWCLEPHDLWVAKQLAGRPQDRTFCRAVLSHGLLDTDELLRRIDAVDATAGERHLLRGLAVARSGPGGDA
ncbi:DUF6036 family nucleotidyltransferase [Euzebya sp.]|uniref:DUF6036 family nucleotidyltransferase n=1 Tax=Euzebya sp. TaxID=1971409 RepID=UPI003511E41F